MHLNYIVIFMRNSVREIEKKRIISYAEAEREALVELLRTESDLILFGEGINDDESDFGITADLYKEFGTERISDLPLAETGISGIAVGAAISGVHVVYMHKRVDFMMLCMDQIVNHASKYRYMSGGQLSVPLVMCAASGKGWGAAAQHAQTIHSILMSVPGIKIVMPSSPYSAKGLMYSAVNDGNPIMFLEHKDCMSLRENVPKDKFCIPIGKALRRREGNDVCIIALSAMNIAVEKAIDVLEIEGISIEHIDLLSVHPYDKEMIYESVNKCRRVVIADTGNMFGGFSKELAEYIYREFFGMLKSPIEIVAMPDTPVPAGYTLESRYYKDDKDIIDAVKRVIN